jgi:hypothetical protein
MSYMVVPEIQYWFNKFIISCSLNREKIPFPVEVPLSFLNRNSFIELLFNDTYSEDSYKYLYRESTNLPNIVRQRMTVFLNTKYYEIALEDVEETEGENLFLLDDMDLLMLDRLLQFRLDPQNTTIDDLLFDSTSFENPVTDSTTDFINYDTVDSTDAQVYPVETSQSILYNLIYLYLDLEINHNTSHYDNMALLTINNTGVTPKEVLECCFEAYLIEKTFRYISSNSV